MKFRNYKIWVFLFGSILILGGILFQQSQTNRKQLENQAIKGMEITRKNVLNAYVDYHGELGSYIQRKFFETYKTGSPQNLVAVELSKIFGSNAPIIDSSRYVPKSSLGLFIPKVGWNFGTSISLLDLNHLLEWDSLPNLGNSDSEINNTFFENVLKTKNFQSPYSLSLDKQFLIDSRIQLDRLMKKDQTNRFFDAILLTDESGMVVFPDSIAGMVLLDFDKIAKQDTVSHLQAGVRINDLEISNNDYKAFWTPLSLRSQKLHLLGLSDTKKFEQVGLRINFSLLSILIFGLILIFCSIPIINVLNLEKGDILSKGKVFGVGLSFILLMIILGVGSSYIKNQHDSVTEEKPRFQDLLSKYQQLYVNYYQAVKFFEPNLNFLPINEFLEIRNGKIQTLWIAGKRLSFGEESSFISISNRDYVAQFSEETYNNLDRKFYIGSHYSRGSGKLESVISNQVAPNQIHAITFNMHEEKNRESQNYNYLVIKEDGKVLHKSQKISTPLDNVRDALPSEKWVEIQNLMLQNRSGSKISTYWEIPLYLNGYEYTGILQLLDGNSFDQPLWFVYLINENLDHYRSSLTSLESSMLTFFYLLILFLSGLIIKISQPTSNLILHHPYTYEWLFPSREKLSRYVLLIILFCCYSVIFMASYYGQNLHLFGMVLTAGLFAVQTFVSTYLLVGPHWNSPDTKQDSFYIFHMGILWLGLAVLILVYQGTWETQVILLLFLGFVIAHRNFLNLRQTEKKYLEGFQNANTIFVVFLALWSILLGFLPGYTIHSSTYGFEKLIWNQSAPEVTVEWEIPWVNGYEKYRRNFLSSVTDPFDTKIKDFIAPDRDRIYASLGPHIIQQATLSPNTNTGISGFWKIWELPGKLIQKAGQNWIFVLLVLVALGVVIFLIFDLVKKIFLTDFVFKKLQYFSPKTAVPIRAIFLCGLDGEQNRKWIRDFFQVNSLESIQMDDMMENQDLNPSAEQWKAKKGWVIENIHFLGDCQDLVNHLPGWTKKSQDRNIPLILTSGKSWKELLRCIPDQHLKIKFTEIFSPFFFEFVPLDYSLENHPLDPADSWSREIQFGRNPDLIREKIANHFGPNPEPVEDEILLIQRYNKAFYANLWEELSFQERKVCYYYSQEGFINYANQESFSELIQKGVLHRHPHKDQLMLFNQTFRNFVLTYISDQEKAGFMADEKANGNSNTIQAAAISFVFLTIALIGYFDRNFLNEAYTYVSAGIGLLGTFYTMLNKGLGPIKLGKERAS